MCQYSNRENEIHPNERFHAEAIRNLAFITQVKMDTGEGIPVHLLFLSLNEPDTRDAKCAS